MQPIRPAKGMIKPFVNVPKQTATSLCSSIVLRVGGSYLFGVYFLEKV